MSVVSAVCNDRFFVWLSTWGTWAQKGVAALCVISGGKKRSYFSITVSLQMDSLYPLVVLLPHHWKLIILFFVCYWCVNFFIFKQWCTWLSFPGFGTSSIFFNVCVWVPNWSSWPRDTVGYTYCKDSFTTAECNESLGRRAEKISKINNLADQKQSAATLIIDQGYNIAKIFYQDVNMLWYITFSRNPV